MAARRWIAANAENYQRASLFSALYTGWALVDQAEAATNALRHDNRWERDHLLSSMTAAVVRQNPDLAERLYNRIQDDDVRSTAAIWMAIWLERTDPERAERYRNEQRYRDER